VISSDNKNKDFVQKETAYFEGQKSEQIQASNNHRTKTRAKT
jgi:hypothetical protein